MGRVKSESVFLGTEMSSIKFKYYGVKNSKLELLIGRNRNEFNSFEENVALTVVWIISDNGTVEIHKSKLYFDHRFILGKRK